MRQLVYLDAAQDDLNSIARHITLQSRNADIAERFIGQIKQQCAKLASLTGLLGRARPELRPDLRRFAFKRYVILFRYRGDECEIVNVIEGHQDIEGMFS